MKRALIVTLALIACAAAVGANASGPAPLQLTSPAGTGEDLVLVVGAHAPSLLEAKRSAERLNTSFGHVQGFYVDAAVDYVLGGIHVQTSADRIRTDCPAPGALFRHTIDGRSERLECPADRSSVRVFRPVRLRYVPRSGVTDSVFPSPCGAVGLAPCQRERYRSLLGSGVALPPSAFLVLTAFRTAAGAEAFLELARTMRVTGPVVLNARKLGATFIGLGQEEHPDGSGPLLGPLPQQASYQR